MDRYKEPYIEYFKMLEEETDLDFSRCRRTPYQHQKKGIEALIKNPVFALFDEMGIGKTKQVIDAAQFLFLEGRIHQVLVVAPAAVRSVWFDKEFGELKKHMWEGVPNRVVRFHQQTEYWDWEIEDKEAPYLRWVITNYEFARRKDRLYGVLDFCDTETLFVVEESSLIKSPRAAQTKACEKIREFCGRVVLLNGTPISHSPKDMFSQGKVMDPGILDCKTFDHFLNRYSIQRGRGYRANREWIGISELQSKFHPYVLRRLKVDCLDLPEKLEPVTLTVPLDEGTWEVYKKLRDEFMAWLDTDTVLKAQQAIVKALRMAQLCGGFLGGLEQRAPIDPEMPEFLKPKPPSDAADAVLYAANQDGSMTKAVGREKLDLLLEWLGNRLGEDEHFKLLVWCRFRAENTRLVKEINLKYPKVRTGQIFGGQSADERDDVVRLLSPDTAPAKKAVVVVGSPQAGGMGLNLAAAHTVVYYSNDYNLKTRLQSEDRVHRPGQKHVVSYYDIVATGPGGQRTIDHTILKALRQKEEVANWTTSAWLEALKEE